MEVELSSNFLKRARRLSAQEKRKLSECTEWFRRDHRDPKLKTHALTGKLKGLYSFSITYGKRVTYVLVDADTALFTDVGSHDEVYR
ncbi:type II toxin-antitoxin system mRNA interferase toxin, RelE/StbE family [Candidatus Gottesmanbacteria bacterium]|nr:type II toxin-antitoxin system mRNA interferase toxin, RelE/StbE family [Candidatus Gottesmanbacteria bacterium]